MAALTPILKPFVADGIDKPAVTRPQVIPKSLLIQNCDAVTGITRRAITKEEIIERTIYALVNEGAKILEEGIALRAVDIDIIYLSGYGFPAWRGGPMWYASTVGLKKVYDRVCEFHAQHGESWTPAPLLKRLAEEGKTFDDFDKEKAKSAGA